MQCYGKSLFAIILLFSCYSILPTNLMNKLLFKELIKLLFTVSEAAGAVVGGGTISIVNYHLSLFELTREN